MSDPIPSTDKPGPTPEVVGPADRRRVLGQVVGLAGVLLAANVLALLVLDRYPINRGNWLLREKWGILDSAPRVDTLVLGDSSCNQGVMPDVLDRALGTRSLNLCTVGNMLAVNDAWMLDEYIRKHGPPRRVVIVHVYDMWARSADSTFRHFLGKIPRPWGFWNRLDPPVGLDVAGLEEVAASRWLPLYAENTSLLRWIEAPGKALSIRFEVDERGFMRTDRATPARVAEDAKKHLRNLVVGAPVLSEDNRRALVRLEELAAAHRIELVIAPSPMFEGLWQDPGMRAHLDRIQAAIRAALGDTAKVRVLDGPPRTFTADQMENVDHIVGAAPRLYTEWLAARMKGTNPPLGNSPQGL